jgi:hypothetical protein
MSDARISSRFLFLGLVMLGGGVIVIYAGAQFQDAMLLVAGGLAVAGALTVLVISVRSYLGIGPAPSSSPAGASVRQKLKHFWAPPEDGPAPSGAKAEAIDATERELGVRLPQAYVRALRAQDGGEPRYLMWAPAQAPEHACQTYFIDLLHDTEQMLAVSRELIKKQRLPKGVVCLCGFADDDWQLCLDYRDAKGAAEPRVVAFDEENECYRLAETFEAFVADLTRSLDAYVYAPQGVLGKAVDGILSSLSSALGTPWQQHPSDVDVYVMRHPVWHSSAGGLATFELRPNLTKGAGAKRAAAFPETWSYRVLHCAIHPRHRPELEQCLSRTGYKWLLVHQPVERLVRSV